MLSPKLQAEEGANPSFAVQQNGKDRRPLRSLRNQETNNVQREVGSAILPAKGFGEIKKRKVQAAIDCDEDGGEVEDEEGGNIKTRGRERRKEKKNKGKRSSGDEETLRCRQMR